MKVFKNKYSNKQKIIYTMNSLFTCLTMLTSQNASNIISWNGFNQSTTYQQSTILLFSKIFSITLSLFLNFEEWMIFDIFHFIEDEADEVESCTFSINSMKSY